MTYDDRPKGIIFLNKCSILPKANNRLQLESNRVICWGKVKYWKVEDKKVVLVRARARCSG